MPKPKRDQDLRDAVSLIQSARKNEINFMPQSRETRKLMGDSIRSWSLKDTSKDIDEFFVEIGMSPHKFYKAAREDDYLADSLSFALAAIGVNIKASLKNDRDFKMKQYVKYDSLSILEKQEKLAAEQEQRVITTYRVEEVQIPKITKED